ncbi:MAG: FecR domain-containing protein [Alphaproteobacteria bacterium]|nr:FecR domain-containing protein [Alphaproteobacteria bacterium]
MRRSLIAVLAIVVLVVMAGAVWRYLRAEAPIPQLSISEVHGEVTVAHPSGEGAAPPEVARAGTVLGPDDRLSTAATARAELTLGPETHIRIGPTSSLQVLSVDATGVSLELENGALEATVRPESGAVRVGNRGRAVLSANGSFQVGVRDDVMQVAATSGDVALSGMDQSRLAAGQQVVVIDRHAQVGEVPEELLLAVEWPVEARTRAESGQVVGTTTPGSRVVLRGSFGERTVIADHDGRFEATVALAEGENEVSVESTDVLGHRNEVSGVLVRDTRGPAFSGGVHYDRGGPR